MMWIRRVWPRTVRASMKVPPKRKGNSQSTDPAACHEPCLNESPSEKEGKSEPNRFSAEAF